MWLAHSWATDKLVLRIILFFDELCGSFTSWCIHRVDMLTSLFMLNFGLSFCNLYVVEETLRSTVYCIIVEVFLLKIVLHYVPFKNQPDDPLKKLSIFFIWVARSGIFIENSKFSKKKLMVLLLSILLFWNQ